MSKIIGINGFCGLICETCLIHLATLETDVTRKSEMRVKIAEQISKIYGTTPKPEIITDCDGCGEKNGRLFNGCADCAIRKCAISRRILNCAYCDDFSCEKLERHYKYDPESKNRLEEIRKIRLI